MPKIFEDKDILERLATWGGALERWPAGQAEGVREALMRQPDLRRAYEAERALDRDLGHLRARLDSAIEDSGSAELVKRLVTRRLPARGFAGMRWQRVAAAMLVAGMLGGAMGSMLGEPLPDNPELAILDPLAGLEEMEL